jgi:hypothetical protein
MADPLESPTLNFYLTLIGLLRCYNKFFWIFKFGLTIFPSKNHANRRKIHKKSINRWNNSSINFLKRKFSKLSKMVKLFKFCWKTKILVFFSCFQVHFLRFFYELNPSRAIKKGGQKISKTEYAVFVQYQVEQTY